MIVLYVRANSQHHGKGVRLRPSVLVVAGQAAHRQWKQYRGKAELICLRKAVSNL